MSDHRTQRENPSGPANLLTGDQMYRMAFQSCEMSLLADQAGRDGVAEFFACLQHSLTLVELGLKDGGRGRNVDTVTKVFLDELSDEVAPSDFDEAINQCSFLWDRAPGGPGRFTGSLRTALAGRRLSLSAGAGDSREEVAA